MVGNCVGPHFRGMSRVKPPTMGSGNDFTSGSALLNFRFDAERASESYFTKSVCDLFSTSIQRLIFVENSLPCRRLVLEGVP